MDELENWNLASQLNAVRSLRILAAAIGLLMGLRLSATNDTFSTPAADLSGAWQFQADPALPNVLLIGDSISIGYTRSVRLLLEGRANVYRPMESDGKQPANCGDTRKGLQELESWLGQRKWAVIHFNWGLWDLCYRDLHSKAHDNRDKVNGVLAVSIAEYERNLEQLVVRLKKPAPG